MHDPAAGRRIINCAVSEPINPTPLEGTEWELVELDGDPVVLGEGESRPYLVLDPDGPHLSGSGGCNRLLGRFECVDDALRFTPVGTTRMACSAEVMRREATFLDALAATMRFELEGPSLVLLAEDRAVARLEASAPTS